MVLTASMTSRVAHCSVHSILNRSCRGAACRQSCRGRGLQQNLPHNAAFLGQEVQLHHRSKRLQAMPVQVSEEEEELIPNGFQWYETMILLRPDLDEEGRDVELAKFEVFLQREGAVGIDVLVRANSQALAYPIKGYWDGIYVLYTYAANPKTAQGVQKLLSTPAVGSETNVLRHMTFKQ